MTEYQFDRWWSLVAKDKNGLEIINISPDGYGKSLRIQFSVNCASDLRYHRAEIKVYNLGPNKRKKLSINALQEELGSGASIRLSAGYRGIQGVIFDGAIHRGYSIKQPSTGDIIMHMECGLPLKQDKEVNIAPQKVNKTTLTSFLRSAISKTLAQDSGFPIVYAKAYNSNLETAINTYLEKNNVNRALGYTGPMASVLNEISSEFNLLFYYGPTGVNVVSGGYTKTPPVQPPGTTDPEITFKKTNGLIGSPIYTDTGAKIITLLRPSLRLFQWVRVESQVLNRNMSIQSLIHRGDSHGDDWFSEMDGSNVNPFARSA